VLYPITITHTRYDSAGRVISPSQRYLTTHNSYKRQTSMPPGDSNPQSQQASNLRPLPQTALPLGSAILYLHTYSCSFTITAILNIIAKLYISAVFVSAHTELLVTRMPQQCSCLHPNLKATTVTFKLQRRPFLFCIVTCFSFRHQAICMSPKTKFGSVSFSVP
jgi:hypothetical protein